MTGNRQRVIAAVAQVERSLPLESVAAAVDVVADHFARLRSLAAALDAHPDALAVGAPPIVGRLVTELIARGSTVLQAPSCVGCGVVGRPLTRTSVGGMCQPCAHRHNTKVCSRCGMDKPVAGKTDDGQPICENCRRHIRGHRRCGICGKTTAIVVRAHHSNPGICANCYRRPEAVCSRCGRLRRCAFADTDTPICAGCTPRATAVCAHCGQSRPPSARWPEGPVCGPCYDAALKRRGPCAGSGDRLQRQ